MTITTRYRCALIQVIEHLKQDTKTSQFIFFSSQTFPLIPILESIEFCVFGHPFIWYLTIYKVNTLYLVVVCQ